MAERTTATRRSKAGKTPTASVSLTERELMILITHFGDSYRSGDPDNQEEDEISRKLSAAYLKVCHG